MRTLAMVKPDALLETERIIDVAMTNRFRLVTRRKLNMTPHQVAAFYAEHANKPFFNELTEHMASGPVTVFVLEHPTAVASWRELIGSTDPSKADKGTIRWMFGRKQKGPRNIVHGSDSVEAAEREIAFFFPAIVFVE